MRAGPTEPTKPDRAGPSCASRTDGTNESRPLRAISCEQDRRNQRNQTFQGHPVRAGPTEPPKSDLSGPSCASRTDGTNETRPCRAILCEQDRRNHRNQTFQGHLVRAGPTEPTKPDLPGPPCASRTDGTNETKPFRAIIYIYIYIYVEPHEPRWGGWRSVWKTRHTVGSRGGEIVCDKG